MTKSRRGKWVQLLCSRNRLGERWHRDQREKGKQLWSGLDQEGPVRGGDKVIFVSLFPSPLLSKSRKVAASGPWLFCSASISAASFPGAFPARGWSELICRESSRSAQGHPGTSWAHQNSSDPGGARQLPIAGHLDTRPRKPEDPS